MNSKNSDNVKNSILYNSNNNDNSQNNISLSGGDYNQQYQVINRMIEAMKNNQNTYCVLRIDTNHIGGSITSNQTGGLGFIFDSLNIPISVPSSRSPMGLIYESINPLIAPIASIAPIPPIAPIAPIVPIPRARPYYRGVEIRGNSFIELYNKLIETTIWDTKISSLIVFSFHTEYIGTILKIKSYLYTAIYMFTHKIPITNFIPGAIPGVIPGAIPGGIPGMIPGAIPGAIPGVIPGMIPGGIPNVIPGAIPGVIPGGIPNVIPQQINSKDIRTYMDILNKQKISVTNISNFKSIIEVIKASFIANPNINNNCTAIINEATQIINLLNNEGLTTTETTIINAILNNKSCNLANKIKLDVCNAIITDNKNNISLPITIGTQTSIIFNALKYTIILDHLTNGMTQTLYNDIFISVFSSLRDIPTNNPNYIAVVTPVVATGIPAGAAPVVPPIATAIINPLSNPAISNGYHPSYLQYYIQNNGGGAIIPPLVVNTMYELLINLKSAAVAPSNLHIQIGQILTSAINIFSMNDISTALGQLNIGNVNTILGQINENIFKAENTKYINTPEVNRLTSVIENHYLNINNNVGLLINQFVI